MLQEILKRYAWFAHSEGMKFAETFQNTHRSVGHWLFEPGSISAFHRLQRCEEIWAIHVGSLVVHTIDTDGQYERHQLGVTFERGEQPLITVPAGAWQAAELVGATEYAFGTNVCAPAFSYDDLEIASGEELVAKFPHLSEIIRRLTHTGGPPSEPIKNLSV